MTALLRLYPAAWRERYGTELVELLAERPPSLRDSVDLLRGALDAHLHRALVPAPVGPDGSSPVPGGLPVTARRMSVGPFLGTLAAGLHLVAAGSILVHDAIPHIGGELTSALVAIASTALGLTVWATTGRAIIPKLAGLAFVSGFLFLLSTGVAMPAVLAVFAGSVLLALGGLVERQPSRRIAMVTASLAGGLWLSYRDELRSMPVILAGYALVAVALALSRGDPRRPVLVGVLACAVVVAGGVAFATATSPRVLHDGYAVQCVDLPEAECLARVDALATEVRALLPDSPIVYARSERRRTTELCVATPPVPGEAPATTRMGYLQLLGGWDPDALVHHWFQGLSQLCFSTG